MYPNGEVPTSLLVQRPSAGKDPCLMMPGTAAKHDRLVQLGAPLGWVPLVSGPDDAYRRLAVQQYYWDTLPSGQAAYPRTSSHGGTYDFGDGEVEQGAVDYGNWSDVGWEKFCELTRAAGFIPGVFIGRPGIPDEPWHVFDPTPWDTTTVPASAPTSEEDSMILFQIDPRVDGRWFVVDPRTGTYYQVANGLQLDALKSIHGMTVLGGPQPPSILDGLSPKQDAKAIVDAAVKQILAALPKA